MTAGDMGRMVKRRMHDAGLPRRLSAQRCLAIGDRQLPGVELVLDGVLGQAEEIWTQAPMFCDKYPVDASVVSETNENTAA
jgi:hypothetical protein